MCGDWVDHCTTRALQHRGSQVLSKRDPTPPVRGTGGAGVNKSGDARGRTPPVGAAGGSVAGYVWYTQSLYTHITHTHYTHITYITHIHYTLHTYIQYIQYITHYMHTHHTKTLSGGVSARSLMHQQTQPSAPEPLDPPLPLFLLLLLLVVVIVVLLAEVCIVVWKLLYVLW